MFSPLHESFPAKVSLFSTALPLLLFHFLNGPLVRTASASSVFSLLFAARNVTHAFERKQFVPWPSVFPRKLRAGPPSTFLFNNFPFRTGPLPVIMDDQMDEEEFALVSQQPSLFLVTLKDLLHLIYLLNLRLLIANTFN
jgi:hypothetical protein